MKKTSFFYCSEAIFIFDGGNSTLGTSFCDFVTLLLCYIVTFTIFQS